jgi:hypothetical protein
MWKYLAVSCLRSGAWSLLAASLAPACTRAEAEETPRVDAGPARVAEVRVPVADAAAPSEACPSGMVLVDGDYCTEVEQRCLRWLDPPGDRYEHFRCAEYAKPATCRGKRIHKRFCIDATERTERGSALPRNHQSWTMSKTTCEAEGARLCLTSEWQFACEGEEMRPYPYGWARDATACNVDVMSGLGHIGRLVDHRTPASAHPRCVSPFGVHDMAGNVDEWASVDGLPAGKREVMKGSWWLPGRHACRAAQAGHGPFYAGTETGTRCCRDAAPEREMQAETTPAHTPAGGT